MKRKWGGGGQKKLSAWGRGGGWLKEFLPQIFVWRTCKKKNRTVPMILEFLGGKNRKVFLWNFFEHPKEILRPAGLTPVLSGQAFAMS